MRSRLSFLLLALAAVCAGVGVASATMSTGPQPDPAHEPADSQPAPESDSVEGKAQVPDGPPWSVLVYKSKSAKTCAVVGQKVGERVGQVDRFDKRFRAFTLGDGPPCDDYEALP